MWQNYDRKYFIVDTYKLCYRLEYSRYSYERCLTQNPNSFQNYILARCRLHRSSLYSILDGAQREYYG